MKIKFKQSRLLKILEIASIIGLSLGIAALVVVMSVADGFLYRIQTAATRYLAPITLSRQTITESDYEAIKETCDGCGVVKFSSGRGVLSKGLKTAFILIDANDFTDSFLLDQISASPNIGQWPSAENEVVIGSEISKKLNLSLGEFATLVVESGSLTTSRHVKIVGIQKFGYYLLDERLVYLANINLLDGFKDAVKVYPETDFESVYKKFKDRFDYPWILKSWQDLNPSLISAIAYEKVTLFLVMAFIVLMAVLNISATVFTMVFERRNEFSVLRALGLEKKHMIRNLVQNSFSIVLKGVVIGILLGLSILFIIETFPIIEIPSEIYGFSSIPSKVSPAMILLIFIFSLSFSLIGAFIPAIIMANRPVSEGLIRD